MAGQKQNKMPIINSHTRPKAERYSKSFYDGIVVKSKDYEYVEDLLNQITADIVNGIQQSDIVAKLQQQLYDGQRQKYTKATAGMYYRTAMHRIKADREEDLEDLKSKLYSQYYQLYAEAMQAGNTLTAKQVLDSIAKIFIGDKPSTAIQINSDKENGITINFGFDDENKL